MGIYNQICSRLDRNETLLHYGRERSKPVSGIVYMLFGLLCLFFLFDFGYYAFGPPRLAGAGVIQVASILMIPIFFPLTIFLSYQGINRLFLIRRTYYFVTDKRFCIRRETFRGGGQMLRFSADEIKSITLVNSLPIGTLNITDITVYVKDKYLKTYGRPHRIRPVDGGSMAKFLESFVGEATSENPKIAKVRGSEEGAHNLFSKPKAIPKGVYFIAFTYLAVVYAAMPFALLTGGFLLATIVTFVRHEKVYKLHEIFQVFLTVYVMAILFVAISFIRYNFLQNLIRPSDIRFGLVSLFISIIYIISVSSKGVKDFYNVLPKK